MLLKYLFSRLFRQSQRSHPHNDENNHYATAFTLANFVVAITNRPCGKRRLPLHFRLSGNTL